jgi:hypothetical protein
VRLSNLLLAVVALTLIISALCIWFYPSLQDFMETNTAWNGIRKFSDGYSAVNTKSLVETGDYQEGDVLVAIAGQDYSEEDLERFKLYVNQGGTLLLMDDFGYGNSILSYLGLSARFSNKHLLDPLFCYRNQNLPRITDFKPEVKAAGIEVIVLNHATTLADIAGEQAIAWSSSASFLDTDESGNWSEGEPKGPFVVAAEIKLGKGTIYAVADPGIIINTTFGRDNNEAFIKYLITRRGEPETVTVDASHLLKAPLDIGKERLLEIWAFLSNPFAILVIMAVLFVMIYRYTYRKGEVID